jgi:hypothetical protein
MSRDRGWIAAQPEANEAFSGLGGEGIARHPGLSPDLLQGAEVAFVLNTEGINLKFPGLSRPENRRNSIRENKLASG